ncbi:GntR family transcriptional regulator [Senegalia massiliensis]|uniref:GntR family transcriptional regulator n=1 Tax=Senegalia massiliensis TaxID=1720316 RepID=A0A845QXZ4_9CLOT|nr:GntR family transcriptional regulator [Senegalia massiliensis]NBI07345.1 GntR family transcriptional regulator [Senegalia massiliensis]
MIEIDKNNKLPLYYQLYEIIVHDIKKGTFAEHDKLPSERELCERFEISRSTVRQAMNELEKDGYIYKEHGRGIFVSPKSFKQDLFKFYSFTDEMKKIGKIPTSKVLDFKKIKSDERLARKLGVKINQNLYEFTRLRLADDEPIMLETSYLPMVRFPNLIREQLEENAMYDIFRGEYNVEFSKAEEKFRPVNTRKDESEILKVSRKVPGMMIERYTYENERVIEYTVSIARGDKFEYRVILEK